MAIGKEEKGSNQQSPKEGSLRGGRRAERRCPGSQQRAVFHRGDSDGLNHMLLSQEMKIIVDLDKSNSLL